MLTYQENMARLLSLIFLFSNGLYIRAFLSQPNAIKRSDIHRVDHFRQQQSSKLLQADSYQESPLAMLKPKTKFDIVWDEHYAELQEYVSQYGHAEVPISHETLGRWVANQRQAYKLFHTPSKHSSMTNERIAALSALKFKWEIQSKWQNRLEELISYKEKYGDCFVPYSFSESPQLGRWVSHQRLDYSYYLQGKKSSMTAERIKALTSIGFEFSTDSKKNQEKLKIVSTHSLKLSNQDIHNHEFSASQRSHEVASTSTQMIGPKSKSQISNRNKEKCENQVLPHVERWNERYQELIDYMQRHGDCLVPQKYKINPKLGLWVKSQRRQFKLFQQNGSKESSMTRDRIKKLSEIGFVWDAKASSTYIKEIEDFLGLEFDNDNDRKLVAYWRNRFQGLHP